VQFDDRPFAPGVEKITWEYIYNDKETPTEVQVLLESSGGGYRNKLFGVPIAGGKFADYPPKLVESEDYIREGLGPLEVSAEEKGYWLSTENGMLVKKDGCGKIVEKLNIQTAQWAELSKAEVALQDAEIQIKDLGVTLDPEEYTVTQDESGVVTVVDNERKVEIYKDGKFNYDFIFWWAKQACEITDFKFKPGTNIPFDTQTTARYAWGLMELYYNGNYNMKNGINFFYPIRDTKYCWIAVDDVYFFFRDKNKVLHQVPVANLSKRAGSQGTWK
jgi:hypothetical protein